MTHFPLLSSSAMNNPWAHVVSISGGKDSTALYLLALERMERLGREFIPVFADTGNEHEAVYEAVANLPHLTGGPAVITVRADLSARVIAKREYVSKHWPSDLIAGRPGKWTRVDVDWDDEENHPEMPPTPANPFASALQPGWKWTPAIAPRSPDEAAELVARAIEALVPSGNPFLDLALWKGRWPSTKVRFCTEELKVYPINDQVTRPLVEAGKQIISWQGVRAEESRARALLPTWQRLEQDNVPILAYRPLLQWKLQDVWAMHAKHGVPRNPLYEQGMGRVGCMPCIMVNKAELRTIAARFPEHIERIARWEQIANKASKRGSASFMQASDDPWVGTGATVTELIDKGGYTINDRVEWSRTSRGGLQYDLTLDPAIEFGTACNQWGACE